ncbi:MAG: VWA domain-containing protein [Armatimonadota bacterium]|nr:VWA domain-containing protein [Armatimonadota bacterium]
MTTTPEKRRWYWAVALSVVLNTACLGLVGWLWVPRPERPPAEAMRTVRVAVWKPAPPPAPLVVKPKVVKRPTVKPKPPKRQVKPPIVKSKPRPVVKPKTLPRKATLAAPSRHPRNTNPKPGPPGGSSHGGAPSVAPQMASVTTQTAAPSPANTPAPTAQMAHSNPNGTIAMPKSAPGNAPFAEPTLPDIPAPGGGGKGKSAGVGEGNGSGGRAGQGNGSGTGNGTGSGSGGGPFGMGTGSGEGPRHIVYVLDISGSMTSRIDRAREELRASLAGLQPGESFNIITFSDDVHAFDRRLDPATPAMVRRASDFLDTLQVTGGTNLDDALARALTMRGVNVVFVMTDGVPTEGETNFRKIARNARALNGNHARIYTVGLVGKNPDGTDDSFEAADLLKQISRDSGGVSKIVPLGVAMP